MSTQTFRVMKLENQGLDNKTQYYLRLDQEGHPPVNINIGETNYTKIKTMTDAKDMATVQKPKTVDNSNSKR